MRYYAVVYSSDYLAHHGILGQKWGVRRFQNKDGSLTPEGVKRYGVKDAINGVKSGYSSAKAKVHGHFANKWAKMYKDDYGMDDEAAKKAAEERIKLAKKVAIGAGVAVGVAAAVYFARDYGMSYADSVMKSGTTIQTLSMDPDRMENGKAFYTAFRDSDMSAYMGGFGSDPLGNTKYKLQATVGQDMKIAGNKTAKKVFNDLMKNDPEFRKDYNKFTLKDIEQLGNVGIGGNVNDVSNAGNIFRKLDANPFKNEYEKFNSANLLYGDETSKRMQDKFFAKLKEKGYSGVNDVNDRKYSGFGAKANIIFDNSKFARDNSGSFVTNRGNVSVDEINKGRLTLNKRVQEHMLRKSINPGRVAIGAGLVGGAILKNQDNEKAYQYEEAQRKKKNKKNKKNPK